MSPEAYLRKSLYLIATHHLTIAETTGRSELPLMKQGKCSLFYKTECKEFQLRFVNEKEKPQTITYTNNMDLVKFLMASFNVNYVEEIEMRI